MQVITVNSCPCCGGRDLDWPFHRDARVVEAFRLLSQIKYGGYMDGWEQHLSLVMAQCRRCGHIWHHTRPDQNALFDMYAHGKRRKGHTVPTRPSARMLSTMRGLFRYCAQTDRETTFLDYGSGAGRWSVAAREAGFRVTAYEPSTIRQVNADGIEVISTLQEIKGRCFDVINLEQVLEHVPDPASDLRRLKQICHSDTVLRISVPDIARYGKKLWTGFPFDGKTMHALSPYEHLHGFRQTSLRALLQAVGLLPCTGWRLALCFPRYVLERFTIGMGAPFGRTLVLARFRKLEITPGIETGGFSR